MKRFALLFAAVLLAACEGRQTDGNSAANTANLAAPAANPMIPIMVEAALPGRRTTEVREGAFGSVCGKVEEQGRLLPFVIDAAGALTVSKAADIAYGDPTDPFPDLHIRHCATEAELRAMQGQPLPPAPPPPEDEAANGVLPADVPPLPPELDVTPAPIPPLKQDRAPAADPRTPDRQPPAPPPASGTETDFFNAVRRPPQAS